MKIFVTGGAGFIGSSLVKTAVARGFHVVNIDKLTYAGNLESLASVANKTLYEFEHLDICDISSVKKLFAKHKPDGVFHLAAESHVDRSIDGPAAFVNTNVIGTFNLLEAARSYVAETKTQNQFRFIHVSTDEVFGSLGDTEYFSESTPYRPNSPYAASKAASDHFARAWSHTYSLPVIVTNCSNNFGPYQFPEKLIPLLVLNALEGKKLPIYGSGKNIRDWIYVEDHVSALLRVFERGELGSTYNIGSQNERQNIDVAKEICAILDGILPLKDKSSYSKLITHVEDRPGHDFRYAIDNKKMVTELEWRPVETFESGLRKTVQWYIENRLGWCERVQSGEYQRERLGLIPN